jgi:hypothetical protein
MYMVNNMTEFNEEDSPLMDILNESEITTDFQDYDTRVKKAKSASNIMRQIEILKENKMLKSSIEDIYDC